MIYESLSSPVSLRCSECYDPRALKLHGNGTWKLRIPTPETDPQLKDQKVKA